LRAYSASEKLDCIVLVVESWITYCASSVRRLEQLQE